MKKPYLLFSLLLLTQIFKAQVPNPGFELVNSNGSIKNWGSQILIAVVLDTSGNATDSLKIDQNFYFSSSDAHTGSKALEMRNAIWQVSGEKIGGRANLTANDSDYSFFSAAVAINQFPLNFSFYYKFIPTGLDTAVAHLTLSDSLDTQVGEALIYISGTHSTYALASTPVVYSSTLTPAFMGIWFSTYKLYSEPNYGSRFVVDDVNLTMSTVGISPVRITDNSVSCFPNPSEKEVNLRLKKVYANEALHVSVMDAGGGRVQNLSYFLSDDLVKLNTEEFSPGIYFINVIHGKYSYTAKFVK